MPEYSFRPVTRADLPMLADWLREPIVAVWWRDTDRQLGELERKLDNPAMTLWIVLQDDLPIAYAQYCLAAHWQEPHYAGQPEGAVAMDVFSGPGGIGSGGQWLRALTDRLLDSAPVIVIDPEPGNARAIRAYEKAGFHGEAILHNDKGLPVRIMTRRR